MFFPVKGLNLLLILFHFTGRGFIFLIGVPLTCPLYVCAAIIQHCAANHSGSDSSTGNTKHNFNVKIGFKEPRSDGGSNARIANILEYGKHGQTPKPFLKPAKSKSKDDCIEAMTDKLESEIEKL